MKRFAATLVLLVGSAAAAADALPVGRAYPSGSDVPENLLRIELRFSSRLRSALSMQHIHLYDSQGQPIEQAFLDLLLPAADARRITLLLHPGRVKSGVGANLALGRALHAGETITLLVDDPALAQPLRKTWRVAPFDAQAPDPARWTVDAPAAGTRSALRVKFEAPIGASAEALIAIAAPDGHRLDGVGSLVNDETAWRFIPARPWRVGRHVLVTHPQLEDAAGNRPCAPFETIHASLIPCEQGTAQPFEIAPPPVRHGALKSAPARAGGP